VATLLIVNSSLFPEGQSASRSVVETFRKEWETQHPGGTVVNRDLAAEPLPHIDAAAYLPGFTAPAERTPEQQLAYALREKLITELEQADAVVIAAPMYNFTIPSSLKAWLDHVIQMGRTTGPESTVKGKPTVVVASRGGSYAPGTPRETFEFVQNYLAKALGETLFLDVQFIVPELTLAKVNPALADLIPLSEASHAKAHADAAAKAKELVAQVA
jgi:FMN-dependent NADH-azoreductase